MSFNVVVWAAYIDGAANCGRLPLLELPFAFDVDNGEHEPATVHPRRRGRQAAQDDQAHRHGAAVTPRKSVS